MEHAPTKRRRERSYTPAEAADRLEWSESSVRRHLMHVDEWRARGGYRSGEVPYVAAGAEYRIPAWWVDRMFQMLNEEGGGEG